MIKKIHYCWFGNNPIPSLNAKCIESWKKYLPDWEIIKWDESKIDINSLPSFAKKAYEAKKYAFVADYVRLKVLFEQGGLYLDTDMELIKDPSKLFDNEFVAGFANKRLICCELIYAENKSEIINKLLKYYEKAKFRKHFLELYNMCLIVTSIFKKNKYIKKNGKYQKNNKVTIYPREYFCPLNPYYMLSQTGLTDNSYSIHHFAGSWKKGNTIFVKITKRINMHLLKRNKKK